MYAVTPKFLEVIGGSHRVLVRVRLLKTFQFGTDPTGIDLPILSGDVKLTARADIKGTVDITVPGDYLSAVQPFGDELFIERGIDYGDRTSEMVPLGYYRIETIDQDNAPYGPIRLSARDRIAQMMQNRVLYPYQVPAGTTHRAIFERLVNGRAGSSGEASQPGYGYGMFLHTPVPITWTDYDPDTVTVGTGQVVEDSTYEFLAKLADGQGCVLRFDRSGELVVESLGVDLDHPVYTIAPGRAGNMVRASRSITRDGVYNIVSAYGSDPAHQTGYQLAFNNDVNSPLYWQGRFGAAPRYFSSPLLTSDAGALSAAQTVLARYTGLPQSLGLFTVPNPALQPLDPITALMGTVNEVHVIEEVTVPLAGDSPVEITTRTVNAAPVIGTEPNPTPTPDPDPDPNPGAPVPANPGELLWIGPNGGQNHFNIGIGGASSHVDHSQAEIFGGYTETPNFCLTPDKRAVQLRIGVDAETTPGSSYPRTELREFLANGTTHAAWNSASGTHYMYGTTTVTHVAATKPWVCIAQIHDADDDVLRIQTEVVSGQLALIARLNDVRTTLLPTYTVGTAIEWRIDVVDGALTVKIGGVTKLSATMSNTGCYFKAGCYAQSNTSTEGGDSSQYFSVELKNFVAWHTGYAAPTTPVYTTPGDPGGNPDDGTQAATVFNWGSVIDGDEFNYTGAPNPAKWGVYNGPGHAGNGLRRPSAFSVHDGMCTITGDNVSGGTTGGMAFRREEFGYRVEWRARTYSINPSAGGNRYHPVLILWPTSNQWPEGAEYDHFESDCDSGEFGLFMHLPNHTPYRQDHVSFPLDIQNWHNYACEWNPAARTLKAYVDGRLIYNGSGRVAEAPGSMHPTFQLDNFFGSNMCPAKFDAMWVRIYQRPNS